MKIFKKSKSKKDDYEIKIISNYPEFLNKEIFENCLKISKIEIPKNYPTINEYCHSNCQVTNG